MFLPFTASRSCCLPSSGILLYLKSTDFSALLNFSRCARTMAPQVPMYLPLRSNSVSASSRSCLTGISQNILICWCSDTAPASAALPSPRSWNRTSSAVSDLLNLMTPAKSFASAAFRLLSGKSRLEVSALMLHSVHVRN